MDQITSRAQLQSTGTVERTDFILDTSAGSKKVSITFVCWEFIDSFSHCGCFEAV